MPDEAEVVSHAAVRVHAVPSGSAPDWKPRMPRRTSRIAFALHAYPDERGGLGLAAFVQAHTDAPGEPLRAGFVLPPKASEDQVEPVRKVAEDLGFEVRAFDDFVTHDLKRIAWGLSTVTAGYRLFETLGLLGVRVVETHKRGGLSVAFKKYPRRHRKGGPRRVSADAHVPSITIRAYSGRRGTGRWTSTSSSVFRGGPLVDLVTLSHAQSGKYPRSLFDLAAELRVPVPETGRTPEALASQVQAIARVYAKLQGRHRSLVGDNLMPSAPTTPGAYSRALVERTGLVPPMSRPGFLDRDPRILGTMEAYHAADVVAFHRGEPVPGCAYMDIAAQFVQVAIHQRAWRFLVASRIDVEDLDPAELQTEIDALDEDALTDPRTLRRFGWTFANLVPAGASLPHRIPGGNGSDTSRVAPFTCPEPVLFNALDLVRARFEDGRCPEISSAFRLVPRGKVKGLRPITLPGAGRFDPNERGADLFAFLFEGRARVRSGEAEVVSPWSRKDLAATLKAIGVSLIGSFAQVIAQPERPRSMEVALTDGMGQTRTIRTRRPEQLGPWYCPPLAAAILAASRLEGFALRHLVDAEGGRPLYSATDSVIAADLSPEGAVRVLQRFERLNPTGQHGPRVIAGPDGLRVYPEVLDGPIALRVVPETLADEVLIDERGERYRLAVPLTFTGWARMRYVLTDPEGRPVYFSEHGLGDLVDADLERFPSEWIGRALSHLTGDGPEPEGLDRPRLHVQAANRPNLLTAAGRRTPAWSPIVLAVERNDLGFAERMLAAPWAPGFDPVRTRWYVFGSNELVRRPELQTVREYLERYTRTRERGTLDEQGRPSTAHTRGPLRARPTVALGIRRVGKEAHDVGEWRPDGPRRSVVYEADRVGTSSRSVADQTFRDACRILRRSLEQGHVEVHDFQGKPIRQVELDRALASRSAPAKLRRAIVDAAAPLVHTSRQGVADAFATVLGVCDLPGCTSPATKGGRWCSTNHRRSAYRKRLKVRQEGEHHG